VTAGGYDAFDDPYSYKGSNCLKNRLGLRDPNDLQAFELEMSSLRATEPLPAGKYDSDHYRRLHRHLFRDVYRWAGQYRTVRTAKGGNTFCYPEHVSGQMQILFDRLTQAAFLPGAPIGLFVGSLAEFLGDLNAIHPFREGNGRTQLAFVHLLGLRAGHPLELSQINPDRFLAAMTESFTGELAPLRKELAALLA
jgi:cell filamentation protein